MQDPLPGTGKGLDPSVVEHLGGEIAAEEAPCRAVESGGDAVLITVGDLTGGERLGAVGEDGAALDQGFVGEGSIRYKYRRTRTYGQSNDGAIFGMKASENRLKLSEGSAEPENRADDGNTKRTRWERMAGSLGMGGKEKSDQEAETDRDEDDEHEPGLHY